MNQPENPLSPHGLVCDLFSVTLSHLITSDILKIQCHLKLSSKLRNNNFLIHDTEQRLTCTFITKITLFIILSKAAFLVKYHSFNLTQNDSYPPKCNIQTDPKHAFSSRLCYFLMHKLIHSPVHSFIFCTCYNPTQDHRGLLEPDGVHHGQLM